MLHGKIWKKQILALASCRASLFLRFGKPSQKLSKADLSNDVFHPRTLQVLPSFCVLLQASSLLLSEIFSLWFLPVSSSFIVPLPLCLPHLHPKSFTGPHGSVAFKKPIISPLTAQHSGQYEKRTFLLRLSHVFSFFFKGIRQHNEYK